MTQEDNTLRLRLFRLRDTITHGLIHLVRELAPIMLFFFFAFLLIFLMLKLFGEKYAIEFSALSKAAVAALIIGKIIAILDWAQSGRRFDTHRPIVVIICKTLIYGLVVFVLGIAEKIFHESRAAGSLRGGIHGLIVNANLDRSFGIISLITSVIGSYLLLQEIDRAMGKGALLTLLFSRPIKPPATEQ